MAQDLVLSNNIINKISSERETATKISFGLTHQYYTRPGCNGLFRESFDISIDSYRKTLMKRMVSWLIALSGYLGTVMS